MRFLLTGGPCVCASRQDVGDGYSRPYQYSIELAASIWTLIRLFFVGRFFIQLKGENVAAFAVLIIGGGANVFCYSVIQFGFSHVYLIMLFAMMLYFTYRYHPDGTSRYIYCLAKGFASL